MEKLCVFGDSRFIPGSAGSGVSFWAPIGTRRVHPRERGAATSVSRPTCPRIGSSPRAGPSPRLAAGVPVHWVHPRARGRPRSSPAAPIRARFILARAASSRASGPELHQHRVDPRERVAAASLELGPRRPLPAVHPRERGAAPPGPRHRGHGAARHGPFSRARDNGFIPACPGPRASSAPSAALRMVHPRARPRAREPPAEPAQSSGMATVHPRDRGAASRSWFIREALAGPSPPARGRRLPPAPSSGEPGVHPRERGAAASVGVVLRPCVGPSPRARGRPSSGWWCTGSRFIFPPSPRPMRLPRALWLWRVRTCVPALAVLLPIVRSPTVALAAHLTSGAALFGLRWASAGIGLSPRAGSLVLPLCRTDYRWFIPATAGPFFAVFFALLRRRVHPRVRGAAVAVSGRNPAMHGSSPRAGRRRLAAGVVVQLVVGFFPRARGRCALSGWTLGVGSSIPARGAHNHCAASRAIPSGSSPETHH